MTTVLVLALLAGFVTACGIAYLVGWIIARREAQAPTDVLGWKP